MKTCIGCEHLIFEEGEPDYSEYTPGSPFVLECKKGRWDAAETVSGTDGLRQCFLEAEGCPDYREVDLDALALTVNHRIGINPDSPQPE